MASALARKSGPRIARSRGPSPVKRSPDSVVEPQDLARAVGVAAVAQRERRPRRRHGETAHHLADRLRLRPVGPQELEPRRRGAEKPLELHDRPARQRRRPHSRCRPGAHGDARALRRTGGARGHRQPPHRPERGQRFAAEAEGQDMGEIGPVDLRGRVPVERQPQLLRRDPVPVILHPQEPLAAVGIGHVDPPRAGVERVLDQLLDRRGRALHHLARGDAVGRGRIELTNGTAYLGGLGIHTPSSSMARRRRATDSWLIHRCRPGYCASAAGGAAGTCRPCARWFSKDSGASSTMGR